MSRLIDSVASHFRTLQTSDNPLSEKELIALFKKRPKFYRFLEPIVNGKTIYTTAPLVYDYNETVHVSSVVGHFRRHDKSLSPIRKVYTTERLFPIQFSRYCSGLYFTRNAEEFQLEVEYGNVILS